MINIDKLMLEQKKNTLEAKKAKHKVPSSIWDTYSSFANTNGGIILLGVEEDKETHQLVASGVENASQMIIDIWNALNNPTNVNLNILLEHHIYAVDYEGKNIIVIEVPKASREQKPIYRGKDMFTGSFKRNHEGDYHCTIQEVKTMIREQSPIGIDSAVLEEYTIDVLESSTIQRYRNRFNTLKKAHSWTALPDNEFLERIRAVRKSQKDGNLHPTLAGLLFFGNYFTILEVLPDYFLDYREYHYAQERWSYRICSHDSTWSGNICDFYFENIDKLTLGLPNPFRLNTDLTRNDDTLAHRAVRECFANALIHADYYGTQGIVVERYPNQLLFHNPGTFRIDIKDAIYGGISDPRNPSIFNLFALIGIGERSGMGLSDSMTNWKALFDKDIIIEETYQPDRVHLTLNWNQTIHQKPSEQKPVVHIALTDKEAKILALIQENPSITSTMLADASSMSIASVKRITSSLKEKGCIERIGATRGIWKILK